MYNLVNWIKMLLIFNINIIFGDEKEKERALCCCQTNKQYKNGDDDLNYYLVGFIHLLNPIHGI